MKRTRFLIIGSGPTGLGAAYHLKDQGELDYLILEKNSWVGGLAASFVDPMGFTWDIGGHVQFFHYDYFDEAMNRALSPEEWLHHQRESWVWIKNRFVPYPFQNNIRFLPTESMWECLRGLVEVAGKSTDQAPKNFREWILASFGSGVANEFMLPYNYKVWAYPPEVMAYQWIGERVATVNLLGILENIVFQKTDASWGPNNTFKFPKWGGTGAIWKSIANVVGQEKILQGRNVVSIDASSRQVRCSNGEVFAYEHLLSTMPLDLLTSLVKETSTALKHRSQELKHSSSNIIGLGIQGRPIESLATKCWMYFPEEVCNFYRMTMFSNYSPNNVPDSGSQFSLMCEVSESPQKHVDRKTLVDRAISGLRQSQLLNDSHQVVSTWHYIAPYGYPTPSIDRDAILGDVIPELDDRGVYSRGRFGGWKYEVSNQDHSFMQGVEWVQRILFGREEKTFRVDSTRDPNLEPTGQRRMLRNNPPAAANLLDEDESDTVNLRRTGT